MNTIGQIFRVTTFGESHGPALGCVVDGCPSGVDLDEADLISQLIRRRPGQSSITTKRKESDEPKILSGIFDGKSIGTPIAIIVQNENQRSEDYEKIKKKPRRGHADDTWLSKFGIVDYRGGGRSSGRETISRVMAGWVAESFLQQEHPGLKIVAFVSSAGDVSMPNNVSDKLWTREQVDKYECRCPDQLSAQKINSAIENAKNTHDSLGGVITLRVSGMVKGLGEPVFAKLHSYLSGSLSSIGTVCGINWNEKPVSLRGSEFHKEDNCYGGMNGGISNGCDLVFKISCKPISTIGELARLGRHDPCMLPRVIPVVESMAAIVLADLALIDRCRRLD